jgi:tetratricopeptide (TPR) repeat protein
MSRWRITPVLMGAALLHAAQQPPPTQTLPPDEDAKPPQTKQPAKPGTKPPAADSDLPPDEDAIPSADSAYSFNPVKSKKSVEVGREYLAKGNFKAAAERFRDATKWNEGNADAWLYLGKAEEKREQPRAARSAYEKYLQLAGNTKNAAEVKKRLEKLSTEPRP